MRIVQSFWSSKRSLIENNFGWLSPQYHLMAWTLSCLKLKEYYSDLHLYTDTNGHAVLIKYLNLPYKTVQVCYDNIDHYSENLWALPKIMTYAVQDEPFIHVDGDVFIWDRFSFDLETAELVSQNFEVGTEYYKGIMDEVRKHMVNIPEFLEKELNRESIPSYNMGIFGGSDTTFIKEYATIAIELIHNNYYGDHQNLVPPGFNILFEQILFYSLCSKEKKNVTTFFSGPYKDFGYATEKIADFSSVPFRLKYLHVIGEKKREKEICELLSRTLFNEYPEYFYKIIMLFKKDHIHFESKIKALLPQSFYSNYAEDKEINPTDEHVPFRPTQFAIDSEHKIPKSDLVKRKKFAKNSDFPELKDISLFEMQLIKINNKWKKIKNRELLETEYAATNYYYFYYQSKEDQLNIVLESNPNLEIIENSFDWGTVVKSLINPHLIGEPDQKLGLTRIPQLFFTGYSEIVIDELDYNILTILKNPTDLKNVLSYLQNCFLIEDNEDDSDIIYNLILLKLKRLFLNKCIFIRKANK